MLVNIEIVSVFYSLFTSEMILAPPILGMQYLVPLSEDNV